jgi:predicted dehydrogenase
MAIESSVSLRIAVIGVGHLGQHHARILATLPGVELVAVVDSKHERAQQIADRVGTRALTNPDDLSDVDAVTIAVPTEAHAEVAMPFLRRGVSVLIEKPLARSLADADAVIDDANRTGAILAVGHTERFNPAVTTAMQHVSRPGFVEIHRLGVFPERSLDIDVVFDLMIHDLDVLLATVGGEVTSIDAIGVPVLTRRIDIANARLRFSTGCTANVTASRISRERVRKVRFFQPQSYLSIDYATQDVHMYRVRGVDEAAPIIEGGQLEVARDEPLKLELEDFVDAVRTKRPPRVTGHDGRRALDLARRITSYIERGASHVGPVDLPVPMP